MVELKNKIVALCNESELSIEAVLFVLKDLYRDAQESYTHYIEGKQQLKEEEKEED